MGLRDQGIEDGSAAVGSAPGWCGHWLLRRQGPIEGSDVSVPAPPSKSSRFNPPPNWPMPPPGWTPPQGWTPDPSWPPPPEGWQLWTEHPGAAGDRPGMGTGVAAPRPGGLPRWTIVVGAVVIGIIVANAIAGVAGHLLALVAWAGAAWSCLRPARAQMASAARTWARIGVAACACLAVYAGSLAVVSVVVSPNWFASGYNFNAAYIAQYYKLPIDDIAWCSTEVGQDSVSGIATNSPDPSNGAATEEWVRGCVDGLYAGVDANFPISWPASRPAPSGASH
jgi:hypothetical protein